MGRAFASSMAAAVALLAAGPAFAQSVVGPGQTVSGRLDDADPAMDDGSRYECWRLRADPGQRLAVTLRSDAFDAYLAIGPGGCDDMDDAESDDDSGGGTDAQIEYAMGSGVHYIRANSLSSGESGTYTLSVAVLGGASPVADEARGEELVTRLLAEAPSLLTDAGQNAVRLAETRAVLAEDETETWTVNLVGTGQFTLIGVCDENCSDLDLTVFDASGAEVGSDLLVDDTPIVNLTMPGRHRVEISMAACGARDCRAGVVAYRR